MGLLDNINLDDPKTMGLLNLGLGILSGNTGRPGDLGQGVMGGFQNYQSMVAQQERKKLLEQQQQMQSTQFDWLKADREKADAQAAARQQALGGVSQQFGIDPNVVAAFPSIGEDLVKNKLIPKAPKIGFAPNGMAYDENNPQLQVGQVYAKPETDSTPSAVKEYQFAKEQGFPGSFMDFQLAQKRAGASSTNVTYGAPVAGVDASGNPVFFQPDKGGGAPAIVPGVKPKPDKPVPMTEAQGRANLFATRANTADKIINDLEGKYSPFAVNAKGAADNMWGIGGVTGPIANTLLGPAGQKAEQAQRDFINAVLRQESGAVIADSEFDNAKKQYFPQPGDNKETIKQKAANRRTAIEGLRTMSGSKGATGAWGNGSVVDFNNLPK